MKKRKQNEKAREEKIAAAAAARKVCVLLWLLLLGFNDPPFFFQARLAKRKIIFKRAESYVKEYRAKERDIIQMKRAARTAGDFYVDAQPKLLFVIRIRGYVKFKLILLSTWLITDIQYQWNRTQTTQNLTIVASPSN